jgi:hypothetical protein
MDSRDSAGVRDIPLSPWYGKAQVARQVDSLQPYSEFADDMRHPRKCLALPQVGNPLAQNRRLNEGLTPERPSQMGGLSSMYLNAVCGKKATTAGRALRRRDQASADAG